jgi:hypothetical protein
MKMPNWPRIHVRDATGHIVQPEQWTDEERHQYQQELADQFRQGEQVNTLDQLREEMTERGSV